MDAELVERRSDLQRVPAPPGGVALSMPGAAGRQLMPLQRAAGNAAVCALLQRRGTVQRDTPRHTQMPPYAPEPPSDQQTETGPDPQIGHAPVDGPPVLIGVPPALGTVTIGPPPPQDAPTQASTVVPATTPAAASPPAGHAAAPSAADGHAAAHPAPGPAANRPAGPATAPPAAAEHPPLWTGPRRGVAGIDVSAGGSAAVVTSDPNNPTNLAHPLSTPTYRPFDTRFGDLQALGVFTLVWRTARLGQLGGVVDVFWEPQSVLQVGATSVTDVTGSHLAPLLALGASSDLLHVELVEHILDWHAVIVGLGYQLLPAPQAQASVGTGLEVHPWGNSCGPARVISFWASATAAATLGHNDASSPNPGDLQIGDNFTVMTGVTVNVAGTERPEDTRARLNRCAPQHAPVPGPATAH